MSELEIKELHVNVEGKEILKGIDLKVKSGEIHALMGPNGSGKSTLAHVLMGHPKYKVTSGKITFNGTDILALSPDKRAKLGLFLGFQYPAEISGVSLTNFLRTAHNSLYKKEDGDVGQAVLSIFDFKKQIKEELKKLNFDEIFADRYLNEGFSGGEKKRTEILQLAVLKPKLAILDETDSGLDIDALKIVSEGINKIFNEEMGILLITHYNRILNYIKPHFVHVMMDGKIVASGGEELADKLEEKGYNWITNGV